jgi:multidrug efflux pump
MVEYGETRLVAAFRGTRQVGFAVVATSVVLIAVFVPIAFLQGSLGRLFSEFALTMAAAVGFSTLVALTLSPMMASRLLPQGHRPGPLSRTIEWAFGHLCRGYLAALNWVLRHRWVLVLLFLGTLGAAVWLYRAIPQEYTPKEDRGTFNILVDGPEGASFSYIQDYLNEIERRLMPYIERGEVLRLQVRAPRTFNAQIFNSGQATLVLNDYARRRSAWAIMEEVRQSLADLPGVKAVPIMRRGFGARTQKPVQFVLGGGTYAELAEWRDRLLTEIDQSNPGLSGIDWDYKETKPQLRVAIDYERAADLGVKVGAIGRTLETMLGSRRVTTYLDAGEEYDVILEGERDAQRTPASLDNLYVRSERSKALIPLSNLVRVSELADSKSLNRFDRLRAITIEANLAEGLALGEALGYLEGLVHQHLPDQVQIGYKGQSKDFQQASGDILFVFALGLVVVFLVLAAQFESWVHPFVIMLTVPLAMSGALFGLWITGETLNIYSQIGLIMLVGLAAKNGILIVEFANQLRDQGLAFRDALLEASRVRLRPILMTSFTAAAGSVPLLLSSGPGAETRGVIGTVILFGVLAATTFTLFVVPVAYDLIARRTGSPGAVARQLEQEGAAAPPFA